MTSDENGPGAVMYSSQPRLRSSADGKDVDFNISNVETWNDIDGN